MIVVLERYLSSPRFRWNSPEVQLNFSREQGLGAGFFGYVGSC
jgi:hypothetical protein